MSEPRCFVCGQSVLGLSGQDLSLEPYYLRDDADSEQLFEAEAFGDVHCKCLIDSP
jgi:hypothetical protein